MTFSPWKTTSKEMKGSVPLGLMGLNWDISMSLIYSKALVKANMSFSFLSMDTLPWTYSFFCCCCWDSLSLSNFTLGTLSLATAVFCKTVYDNSTLIGDIQRSLNKAR